MQEQGSGPDPGPSPRPPETAEATAADATAEPSATGVPSADAAAETLRRIDDAPLDEHVDIYEDVHRRLQEGLADLDER